MYQYEINLRSEGFKLIAGVDEVGRGPLAGPLVVAAVILPCNYVNDEINDSKKLSAKKRLELFNEITSVALDYNVIIIEPSQIDKVNIYEATKIAMKQSLENLKKYDVALIDAMKLELPKPSISIIKGDSKSISIAAASIVAKVTRDKIMDDLDAKYPKFNFKNHKGYCTKEHLEKLEQLGPIVGVHRFSYSPVARNNGKKI